MQLGGSAWLGVLGILKRQSMTVGYEQINGVAKITFQRPDVLNSFNADLRRDFLRVCRNAATDDAVRAVVLTGAGRGFCAGQDLAELRAAEQNGTPLSFELLVEAYNEIVRTIVTAPKPYVCAVNGVAAGAGANLALACDFVLAASSASFVQAFVHVGLSLDSGGSFFLPRLVGLAKAKELAILGEKISAEEALRIGMIYQVCDADTVVESAVSLAQRLAGMPTGAIAKIKNSLLLSLGSSLFQQLEVEKQHQSEAARSRDYREGIAAFVEKRPPKFEGK